MVIKNKIKAKVKTPQGFCNFFGVQRLKKKTLKFKTCKTEIVVSEKHPFIVNGDVLLADTLKIGDFLQDDKNNLQRIEAIKKNGLCWVYDLVGVENDCYYANGILVHNCFLDAGNSAVGAAVIERFKEQKKPAIYTGEEGAYKVFEAPDVNKLYAIGVDVGEGIGRAASVAQVMDITDLTDIRQVAVYGANTVEPYHYANKLVNLCSQWGNPPLLVERNNCGAQIIDALFHKHMYEKIVSCSKLANTGSYSNTRHLGILSHNNLRFAGVANMRYWVNFLQVVHINDLDTIKEFETFIRYPNGTYRKKNDLFYDDRIMSLVWALFILEPEVCQQYFNIDENDDQNKPLKISDNGYYETDKSLYKIKDLNNSNNITTLGIDDDTKYQPLISENEFEKMFDTSDMDDLMSQGWKPM